MTDNKKQRCPSCGNTSVRKRGVSTPANISRRTIEEKHHRFVCDAENCQWSGTRHDIDWRESDPDDANNALTW